MLSRRRLVGMLPVVCGLPLFGQAQRATDEMTRSTAQEQEHFSPPDFGPAPAELPAEALAVGGKGSLRETAATRGLVSGAALVVRALEHDGALRQLYAAQCGVVVPENELKWMALRPAAGEYDFAAADALFRFAAEHGQMVRGHTLVWHNSVPKWMRADGVDARKELVEHIRTVVGRYRGRVHSWDVVNEAILPKDGEPGGMRRSFWYERVGKDYVELAFRTARAADGKAKLTYNDYGVEYDNADETERRRCILEMLRGLQGKGVPIDAVGVQGHIKAAASSVIGDGLRGYLEAIRAMKLEIYVTELDVNEDDVTANDAAARDAAVAATYGQFLGLALGNPATRMVLTWGISDRRTWLNDGPTHHRKQPNRPQRSLPFDPEYRPAPAFFAMRDAFARGKA